MFYIKLADTGTYIPSPNFTCLATVTVTNHKIKLSFTHLTKCYFQSNGNNLNKYCVPFKDGIKFHDPVPDDVSVALKKKKKNLHISAF
jgi:hypothetical protein